MTTRIFITRDVGDIEIVDVENNQVLTYDDVSGKWINKNPTGGGHVIQADGTPLTARSNLNFAGLGVTVEDDPANDASKVTIAAGGGDFLVGQIFS